MGLFGAGCVGVGVGVRGGGFFIKARKTFTGVFVGISVGVFVGEAVDVKVGVGVSVMVGGSDGVAVGVAVAVLDSPTILEFFGLRKEIRCSISKLV